MPSVHHALAPPAPGGVCSFLTPTAPLAAGLTARVSPTGWPRTGGGRSIPWRRRNPGCRGWVCLLQPGQGSHPGCSAAWPRPAARFPAGGAVSRTRARLQGRRSAGCCLAQSAAAGQRGAAEQGASHRSKTPAPLLVRSPGAASPECSAFPLSGSLVKPADAPSAPLALSTGRPRGVTPRPCSEGRGVRVCPGPVLRALWAHVKSWVLTGIPRWLWAQSGTRPGSGTQCLLGALLWPKGAGGVS